MKLQEVQNFKDCVDAFTNSKFILYDRKLELVMQGIADSDDVYNLISKTLKNFDFETEKNNAVSKGSFILPAKAERVVAIVFCLLSDIDEKKIDFYKFLTDYFNCEDINESFKKFCDNIMVPFKNTVLILLQGIEEAKKQMDNIKETEPEIDDEVQAFIDEVDKLIETAFTRKDTTDAGIILKAVKYAVLDNNQELYTSLKLAIKNSTRNGKFLKLIEKTL